jgi:hypothetical protein
VAFAAAKFRNPTTPHRTNNTKATTESHFDIETLRVRKLTRRHYMYPRSLWEQESVVSKQ